MFDCFEYNTSSAEDIKSKYFIKHDKKINELIPIITQQCTDKFAFDVIYVQKNFELLSQKAYSVLVVTDGIGAIFDDVNNYTVKAGDKFFIEANTKVNICSEKGLNVCILKP